MVLLDTNIFIIDRFFKRDENYEFNQKFLSLCSHFDVYISIFTLFELCGIASFNLSVDELNRWLYHFNDVYAINILEVKADPEILFYEWFEEFSKQTIDRIIRKMTFNDALLLKEAEEHSVEKIVTWNKKHFEERTEIQTLTPKEFVALYG